jgi:hypothetical protein
VEPANHTNPLEDALSHGSQRVAQVASLAAAMSQVVMQRRMLAGARRTFGRDRNSLRVLADQQRMLHQQARLTWTPALDAQWLANADLIQVARAWAAAAAHADMDPSAALAQRRCEARLRSLHPYAMTYYDRLRGDGMDALDAMREAAPMFARPATARPGDPGSPRLTLGPGTGADAILITEPGPGEPMGTAGVPDEAERAELRGQQIIDRLQARVRAAGRPELGADEIAIFLEETTNLPTDVIERLAQRAGVPGQARGEDRQAVPPSRDHAPELDAAAYPVAAPGLDEPTINLTATQMDNGAAPTSAPANPSPAQLAAQSFPHTAAEALRAAGARGRRPATSPSRTHAPHNTRRRGRTL